MVEQLKTIREYLVENPAGSGGRMYRTCSIRPIADEEDLVYDGIGPFRFTEINILIELLPGASIWTTHDKYHSLFEPTMNQVRELYDLMLALAETDVPSTEPRTIGQHFGMIPVMRSPLEIYNRLIPYLETVLEVEKRIGAIQVRHFAEPPLT